MEIQIKNRYNDSVIFEGDFVDIRQAVETAVKNKVNLCGADLGGTDLTGADLTGADMRVADLFGADLSGANLCGVYLSWADLRGAYLRGASLYGADLSGADLTGADLIRADLSRADLCGTNLYGTIFEGKFTIDFQFERHRAFFFGKNEIVIGCHRKTVKEWLETYKEIGRKEDYTDAQIEKYGEFIRQCAGIGKGSESVFSRIYKTIRSKF